MRRVIFSVMMIFVAASSASALDTKLGFGGFGALNLGAATFDVSGINHYLAPAGVSDFSNTAFTLGGELYGVIFERVLLGASGAFSSQDKNGPNLDVRLTTGDFMLDGGFLLFDYKGLRGYPMLGIGVGAIDVNMDGDYSALPLAEQAGLRFVPLESPRGQGVTTARLATDPSVNLNYAALVAKLAFHLDYYYPFAKSEDGFAFFLTGLRVGVMGDVFSAGWSLDSENLNGPKPDFRYNTFFARLSFGFGGGTPKETAMKAHRKYHDMMHHHEYEEPPPPEPEKKEAPPEKPPAPPTVH